MSIRVSQEHGVNPSVGLCFFCRKAKEVVLLGAMTIERRDRIFGEGHSSYDDKPGDAAAPREAVYNMEPCDECKGHMELGIICISVDPKRSEDMHNPWFTGGWCVVREEAAKRWLTVESADLLAQILERRFMLLEDEVWDKLGLPRGEEKADGQENTV